MLTLKIWHGRMALIGVNSFMKNFVFKGIFVLVVSIVIYFVLNFANKIYWNYKIQNHLANGRISEASLILKQRKYCCNEKLYLDMTPLMVFALAKDEESFLLMFDNNIHSLYLSDIRGRTVMDYIAARGTVNMITKSINSGADINKQSTSDPTSTLLHTAARSGHIDMVRYLFEQGINIDSKDRYGNTPLMCAVSGGHETVVTYLLKNKADYNLVDRGNFTPLMISLSNGGIKVATEILLLNPNLNIQDDQYGRNALMIAIQKRVSKLVEMIIAFSPNLNAQDREGNTALHTAVYMNDYDTVSLLVKNGANTMIMNKNGKTPLELIDQFKNTRLYEKMKREIEP